MNYFNWFLKEWKKYIIWFVAAIVIVALYVINVKEIWSAPVGIAIGMTISTFGFAIGIFIHSYSTWKAFNKPN